MSEIPEEVAAPSPEKKRWPLIAAIVVLILVAAGVGAVLFLKKDSAGAQAAATSFAASWTAGQIDAPPYTGTSSADVAKDYAATVGALSGQPVEVSVTKTKTDRNKATANLHVKWRLDSGVWEYDTAAQLVRIDRSPSPGAKEKKTWAVQWARSIVHPRLSNTDRLGVQRTQPPRADILSQDRSPLVTARPVVVVGVEPRRAADVDALSAQLGKLLSVDAAALNKQIRAAKPDAFVEVITLRDEDYRNLQSQITPLAGTVFRQTTLPLAPSRSFASATVGRVGQVTAEIVQQSKGRYRAGDTAGLSGLQLQYDERLAGKTGVDIRLVRPNGEPEPLFSAPPQPGVPVIVTLDAKAQQAAEAALANVAKPSAFVALQISTGDVLAVANGPEVGGTNRALLGQYPPGSSFKVVGTYALLEKGLSASDSVPCPPTINVGGRTFKNAEDESFAAAPFHVDFAHSCNTAFAGLSSRLGGSTLPDTAARFQLGQKWDAGIPVFTGSVPRPNDAVDVAASTIGQGRILMSPIAMANVAACVGRGSCVQPRVVVDPAPNLVTPVELAAGPVSTLRSLMREVVTSGTGTAVANVPGGPVQGKTGTAEFGNSDPPASHAWFIGFQGDIAFAAFVEGGEFGGETAAPIAAAFLRSMAS